MTTQTITSSVQGNVFAFSVKGKMPLHHSDVPVCASIPVPVGVAIVEPMVQLFGQIKMVLERDGPISATPIDQWGFRLMPQIAGDLDGDGKVDGADLGLALAGGDGAVLGAVLAAFAADAQPAAVGWGVIPGAPALSGWGKVTGAISPPLTTQTPHSGGVVLPMGWMLTPDTSYHITGTIILPILTPEVQAPDPPAPEAETVVASSSPADEPTA